MERRIGGIKSAVGGHSRCDSAKSTAAALNTDGSKMLGELLEETSDLGLGYEKSLKWVFPK